MMIFNIKYKEYNIMRVLYKDKIYYTNISFENIDKAKKEGFLIGNISETKVISDKCPDFILNRLANKTGDINDIKTEILQTNAKLQTDKIFIEILEN